MSTAKTGDWVKALRPGTIPASTGDKFIKAGEKFQLTDDIPFSDKWMEKTDAPETAKPPSKKEVEAEQDASVREHEETDRIRRGKYSLPAVPRSEESQRERREQSKEDLRRRDESSIDRGSKDPRAPGGVHETSANPSRIDENAKRKDK